MNQPQLSPRFTRRAVLGFLGATGASVLLGGCDTTGTAPRLLTDLPDPYLPRPAAILPRPVILKPAVAAPVSATPAVSTAVSRAPYLPRSSWTRTGPNMRTIEPLDGARLITFHHSGDPKPFTTTDFAETAKHLEIVREVHRRDRKFNDIGYHFAIDRAGRVWELRSLAYQGAHVSSANEHNIGIVVLGNFNMQTLSAAQKDAILSFGSYVRTKFNIGLNRVYTHQEIGKSDCPGDNMQPYMVQVRKQGKI